LRKCDPEGAIKQSQSRLRLLVCVGGELLAQGQLDNRLLATASEEGADARKDDQGVCNENANHVLILREAPVEYQTDSKQAAGISSIVDNGIG
jgi:hypothetical protein